MSGPTLGELLEALRQAKAELIGRSEALRELDARVRAWDVSRPLLARRSLALRADATRRFTDALDALHAVLAGLGDEEVARLAARSPSPIDRDKVLAEIRAHLLYVQRAFDGGSTLIPAVARALERGS